MLGHTHTLMNSIGLDPLAPFREDMMLNVLRGPIGLIEAVVCSMSDGPQGPCDTCHTCTTAKIADVDMMCAGPISHIRRKTPGDLICFPAPHYILDRPHAASHMMTVCGRVLLSKVQA